MKRRLLGLLLVALAPCLAATIPSWLDDAIAKWNGAHPEAPVRFIEIKDSFVWYDTPKVPEIDAPQIRERIAAIVQKNGYVPLDQEESVTTARPPVAEGRSVSRKCWRRSFVLSETHEQRQRMLTSLVCEGERIWWAAFRVAE